MPEGDPCYCLTLKVSGFPEARCGHCVEEILRAKNALVRENYELLRGKEKGEARGGNSD